MRLFSQLSNFTLFGWTTDVRLTHYFPKRTILIYWASRWSPRALWTTQLFLKVEYLTISDCECTVIHDSLLSNAVETNCQADLSLGRSQARRHRARCPPFTPVFRGRNRTIKLRIISTIYCVQVPKKAKSSFYGETARVVLRLRRSWWRTLCEARGSTLTRSGKRLQIAETCAQSSSLRIMFRAPTRF